MNCVLITVHPMLGLDGHNELGIIPPAPPAPCPFHPHIVGATLRWLLRPALAESVQSVGFSTMQRGTDIQSGIPHVPVPLAPFNLLWPVFTAFSGSKSHFGVATVIVEKKPVAVAVTVIINVNLNCGDIPTPTGFVIAPNTVVAQMTFADWLGGVFSMLFDCIVQALLSRLMGGFGIGGWKEGILGIFVGTPLGFSANSSGQGIVGLGGRLLGGANDYVRGIGESWGGAPEIGQETRDGAVKTMGDALKGAVTDPFGWKVGDDAKVIFDRPIQGWNALPSMSSSPSPSPASSALDNPNAEQF
jgi:hypothetical protein